MKDPDLKAEVMSDARDVPFEKASPAEVASALAHLREAKNFMARSRSYENAARLRDMERLLQELSSSRVPGPGAS
jgi:predicted RNA-binding Zn ribbon-like protein